MYKFLLFFYFLLITSVQSEIISNMEVTGNKRVSAETIKVYGDITFNKDYSKNELNNVLKGLYETNFFENVTLKIENGILKINVKEYQIINRIEFQGEKAEKIKKQILDLIELKNKSSFRKSALTKDIDMIKKVYASMGFNFVEVETKIEQFSDERVNLIFFVDKGQKTGISKIYFIGDKKIKDKRLRDIIVSEETKFWKFLSKNVNLNSSNIELDKRLLSNYYKSIGYYDVQIVSSSAEVTKANLTTLTYNINAGNRYRIKKISTEVSSVFDKELFIPLNKEFNKIIGKFYSPFRVTKLLEELDGLISSNDLQFVEHSVNEIIDEEGIEIKINIYEGSKQLVERINVKGNTITNESVIRSELLLDEGDPFNKLKLEQSIAKLKSRNIFGSISKDIIEGENKDQKIIDITVEEKATGEISAGAGVGTTGGSFQFNIKENNWLGEGIEVGTYLNVDKNSLAGTLDVKQSNYNNSDNELNYFISSATNDFPDSGYANKITSLGIGTKFEQYRDIYISPSLSYTYDDLTVDSTASKALAKQSGGFSDLAFSYGIQQDKRDRVYMPTDGYVSSFSQTLPIYADAPYFKNTYKFSGYESFTKNVIGSVKFFASSIVGLNDDDVRLSKRIYMPQSRLRGFKKLGPKDGQDYVGGNYATSLNFEVALPYFLPESTKTDVGLFLDFGNVWEVDYDSKIDDSNKIRSTAGLNTSWISPVGPMSFVLSTNISKATTDKTESFNFKLGTTF
jgi:outer membrane protein insertion porin family